MTPQSMTGYGKAERREDGFNVAVEIKSVNGRFLELQFKTSKNLMALEPKLKQILGQYVARGSVTCHLQYEARDAGSQPLALNEPVFDAYRRIIQDVRGRLDFPTTLNIGDLMKLPDFLAGAPAPEDAGLAEERVLPVFERACAELADMRAREGETLAKDLEKRVRGLAATLEKIRALLPGRQSDYVSKIRSKVQELAGGEIRLSEDRMMTELGLMAERLDVTEEIVRFQSHVDLFLDTLRNHKGPGKKLGFILQEMLREINTLGTKSQYSDIQHMCVSAKEELEIIREQIQNLE